MTDMTSQQIQTLSVLVSRMNLATKLGMSYDNNRDLYQALGWPEQLEYGDFYGRYRRQDIVKAVVDKPIKATWRKGFTLIETNDDEETEFEIAWKALDKELKLATKFARADRLTAFGMYGVLLLGFDDAKGLEDFAKPVAPGKRTLKYVRPFGQNSAQISQYEIDPQNERFGQPFLYDITTAEAGTMSTSNILVHYSRIIHITEDLLESETEGISRLEAPYNRFMDLEKLVGGSAEMFWRGARPGYHGKVDPEFTMTQDTKDDMKDQIDEYEHNLRRIIVNQGIDMQALQSQVADPSTHVNVQLQMISAVTGIPLRILVGSERGELASTQDQDAWYSLIDTRQTDFAEPCIIRPFADRCILYGVLPTPTDGDYTIEWPPMFEQSDESKARVGQIRASALKDYSSNPQAESIIPPEAFFEFFLGFDQEQIDLIQEMVDAGMQEEDAAMKQLGLTPEQMDQMQNPDKWIDGKKIIPGTEPKQGAQPAKKAQPAGVKTQDLENNSFPGHAGRPGQVGGSQARGSSGGISFEGKERHAEYQKAYSEYSAFFGAFTKADWAGHDISMPNTGKAILEIRAKAKLDFPNVMRMLDGEASGWQTNPQGTGAASLRLLATHVEPGLGKMFFAKGDSHQFEASHIPEYVKMRAMNQAYMETRGINSVTLYRGTDGKTGKAIAKTLQNSDNFKSYKIQDMPLAGYSSERHIADGFGVGNGGVTIKRTVSRSDIIVHADLFSGVTGRYDREMEYIVKGGTQNIKKSDITYSQTAAKTVKHDSDPLADDDILG